MDEYVSREAVFQVVHGIARGIADRDTEALKAKNMKAFYMVKGAKEILDSVDTDLCYIPAADVKPVKYSSWEYCTYPIVDRDGVARRCMTGYVCKACGHGEPEEKRFCGGCGAEMQNE